MVQFRFGTPQKTWGPCRIVQGHQDSVTLRAGASGLSMHQPWLFRETFLHSLGRSRLYAFVHRGRAGRGGPGLGREFRPVATSSN